MSAVTKARPGRRPDPALRSSWQERLRRQEQSGLSPADFCIQEGVALSSFHSWRRKLRPKAPTAEAPLFGLHLLAPAPPVELLLPHGALLRLSAGCDLDLVRSLLVLLAEARPC